MMVRKASKLLGIAAAVSGVLVLSSREVARRYLFPIDEVARRDAPSGFERHALVAADGASVRALELPAGAEQDTIVLFHNNRATIEEESGLARALHERGFGVLLVEYRGYGHSRGTPSEEGLYLDAEAGLHLLSERGVGADRIILFGTSLGTGVAAEMARRGWGGRLVLVTPYTSIPDLVTDAVPFLPASLLVPDHFDTLSKARAIRVPTLVVHGDADEIVPHWMGARLARTLPQGRLHTVPGGRHGDLFGRAGAQILEEVVRFARAR
ncbi:MAG: alpha/beta hydrolase [Polyangiaceae bacterium]|nr:alpha/beta hydrolase [Polyangiaceae bacterium]